MSTPTDEAASPSAPEPQAAQTSAGQGIDLAPLENAEIETTEGVTCSLAPTDGPTEGHQAWSLTLEGNGSATLSFPAPLDLGQANGVWLWAHTEAPASEEEAVRLTLLLEQGNGLEMGAVAQAGWQVLFSACANQSANAKIKGLRLEGSFSSPVLLADLRADRLSPAPLPAFNLEDSPVVSKDSFMPALAEDVTVDIRKEDISFILESRSVSSVVRYVYTPIEGNLSDIELEINNGDALQPFEEGGITVDMGGQEWDASDEGIERHFVSCEIVGENVEARWQWKCGDELADFLYRFSIQGKSLSIEFEGGNGKATGVNNGYVSGAPHPKQVQVPFLNLGPESPTVLCLSGVFLSSFVDWTHSNASTLFAPAPASNNGQLHLNGGCRYLATADGRRAPLRERLVVTVSRQFHEVLPLVDASSNPPETGEWRDLAWYSVDGLDASEEAYIEAYEELRALHLAGIEKLAVHHSPETWNDGEGTVGLAASGAPAKGGSDALEEYLEAIGDMGFKRTLYVDFTHVAPTADAWSPDRTARDASDVLVGDGASFRLKAGSALELAPQHFSHLQERYAIDGILVGTHAETPSWERLDFDSRLGQPDRLRHALAAERALLNRLSASGPTFAAGGSHWLMAGQTHGYSGRTEALQTPVLDFALFRLHSQHLSAGLGSIDQFAGADLDPDQLNSQSATFDRYLALTAAFGHAAFLPNAQRWGLEATAKAYFMLQPLQERYIDSEATQVLYHHDGNLLEATEAIIADAHLLGQVQVTYANGLQIHANIGSEAAWTVLHNEVEYTLPPGSFLATAPDGLLVFSADRGEGRLDFAQTDGYLYFDTRGTQRNMGPVEMQGAALVANKGWELDITPFTSEGTIDVDPGYYWEERRRLPKLRLLAYFPDEEPAALKPTMSDNRLRIEPADGAQKYRITLPEWMVEPGK